MLLWISEWSLMPGDMKKKIIYFIKSTEYIRTRSKYNFHAWSKEFLVHLRWLPTVLFIHICHRQKNGTWNLFSLKCIFEMYLVQNSLWYFNNVKAFSILPWQHGDSLQYACNIYNGCCSSWIKQMTPSFVLHLLIHIFNK